MNILRERDGVLLRIERPLAEWLSEVLESLARRYGADFADLDPKTSTAWYWPKGVESAGGGRSADREEMLRQAVALRSERIPLLKRWIAALGGSGDPATLRLPSAEAEVFVAGVNDHRLALAMRHGWMDTRLEQDLEKIADGTQRVALAEIHFLGAIVGEVLEAM